MGLVIRLAVPADQGAIARLHAESWRQSYRDVLDDAYLDGDLAEDMVAMWRARLEEPQPGWLVLVAELEGAFAGFYAAGPDPEDPSRDLIDNLHVDTSLRSRGLGAALMREGSDRLAAMGRHAALLQVVESNHGARAFYSDLGGAEGLRELCDIGGGKPVMLVPYTWSHHRDIATSARRRLARRLNPPLALSAADVPALTGEASGADHPVAAGANARRRVKQRLGDAFGLTDFGVNRVALAPGTWSSIPHFHSREDEFIQVLEGVLTLVSGDEARELRSGDCAGFPAGLDRPHHLENRSDAPATYLEIGSRRPDIDECDYAGEDLRVVRHADERRGYARRDGSALDQD